MPALVEKAIWIAVRGALAVVLFAAVILNPAFDDVVSLNGAAAAVRDEAVAHLPASVTLRPRHAPTNNQELLRAPVEASLSFRYRLARFDIPLKLTQKDLLYDVDISSVWAGSRYERSHRVSSAINDYAREPMVAQICSYLRRVKHRDHMTDSEYVDLVAALIQDIPYDPDVGDTVRSPVRLVMDDMGDCDERAFLGAAILRHEGYDAAIFEFRTEGHAALGVRSSDVPFPGTGYAFIETTEPMPVGTWGEITTADGGSRPLLSDPLVIGTGGKKGYSATD